MSFINGILNFLEKVLVLTINQVVGVLGIFFILGFILYFLEKLTFNCYFRTIGWKGILWTAWIGTPVHELGHAVFCIIFKHRIEEIKFYEPDPSSGTLGYVYHTWDEKRYQMIGNFFIGVAPIIFGSIAIYIALYYFVPNSREIFNTVTLKSTKFATSIGFMNQLKILSITSKETLKVLFTLSNLSNYKFWIFLYITFCIAGHMAPSPPDMQGAWRGLGTIIGILLMINFFTLLFGFDVSKYILLLNNKLGFLIALFIFSIVISLTNFLFSYIVLSIYSRRKYGGFLNPF